jgi:hypothetical protein
MLEAGGVDTSISKLLSFFLYMFFFNSWQKTGPVENKKLTLMILTSHAYHRACVCNTYVVSGKAPRMQEAAVWGFSISNHGRGARVPPAPGKGRKTIWPVAEPGKSHEEGRVLPILVREGQIVRIHYFSSN